MNHKKELLWGLWVEILGGMQVEAELLPQHTLSRKPQPTSDLQAQALGSEA